MGRMSLPWPLRHPLLALAEPAAAVLERIGQRRNRTIGTRAAGQTGERLVYFHLRRNGYTVVARQWRAPNLDGEIDLIAWHGDTLCFVEVKTRTRTDRFAPEYAIGPRKQQELRRMAAAYVQSLPGDADEASRPAVRFDSVSVLLDRRPAQIERRVGIF